MKRSNKTVGFTLISAVLLLIIIILIVPMLYMARYTLPYTDDFDYGGMAYHAFKESGSVLRVISAAFAVSRSFYESWQGTFSATFMMALQPGVFGDGFYPITAYFMLFSLLAGTVFFCRELFSGLFGLGKNISLITAELVFIACTQLLPVPREAFFWYNGSVYYCFFFSVSLFLYALIARQVKRSSDISVVLMSLLAVFIGGGNYITALSAVIIFVSTATLLFILRHKAAKSMLIPTAASIASLVFSVIAPGNSVRQISYAVTPGVIESVLLSFKNAFLKSAEWFSLPLLGVLIFLALVYYFAGTKKDARFPLPALVSVYSFCLLAAMFCPTIYAMGTADHGRVLNIIYFAYVILLAINCFYWLGWLKCKKNFASAEALPIVHAVSAAAVVGALCIISLFMGQHFTSLAALGSLRQGEPQQYYIESMANREILLDPEIRDAEIERIRTEPTLLYIPDDAVEEWVTGSMAFYFEKDSVRYK